MLFTRTSPVSRKTHTKDIPCTDEQVFRWVNGELIQKAFPHLSADDREFIMTGITAEEWECLFP
jgi:hypothetical protein